mgnify:CR=1 FL=1
MMRRPSYSRIRRVLIYRLASLGDTVVSLPCFHAIERTFPRARRMLLTVAAEGKRTFAMSLLEGTGLVDGAIGYPLGTRRVGELLAVRERIVDFGPDILFYFFARPKSYHTLVRDWTFFRLCGITRMVGLPFHPRLRRYRRDRGGGRYEHVAEYMGRCIGRGVDVDVSAPRNWDLRLGEEERQSVRERLGGLEGIPFLAFSPGTKMPVKDWGRDNWLELVDRMGARYPAVGAAFLGVEAERERCEALTRRWSGPSVNLAGELDVRRCACLISRARLFVGHDSGPMHLASAVQTPAVAIFTARAKPGLWFPYPNGVRHEVLYRGQPCSECGLVKDCPHGKRCIASIRVEDVVRAIEKQRRRYWPDGGTPCRVNVRM